MEPRQTAVGHRRRQVVVLAAGDGSRFTPSDVPKHLAVLAGETILGRVVRLWVGHCDALSVIVPPELVEQYRSNISGAASLIPRSQRPTSNSLKYREALRAWDGASDLVIVFGDVFFTQAAIETISHKAVDDEFLFFCRFGASPVTGAIWGEPHAIYVPASRIGSFRDSVDLVHSSFLSGELWRDGGWEIAKALSGVPVARMHRHIRLPSYVEIDDLSDDIDYLQDYQRMVDLVPQDLDEAIERLSRLSRFTAQLLISYTRVHEPLDTHDVIAAVMNGRSISWPRKSSPTSRAMRFTRRYARGAARRITRGLGRT